MEDREEELPASGRRIKKAKSFGWRVITFIFGILFIASIALCILFATGIITIEESEDGRSFVFSSPLAKTEEDDKTEEPEQAAINPEPENESESESSEEVAVAPQNNFAGYDFKINSLISSAKTVFPDSQVYVDDLRATASGDYLVARLFITSGEYGDAKYYYRSVQNDSEWILIKAMGSQAAPVCEEMSELERKIIRESYPEKNSCRHDDGSFENV